MNNFKVFKFGGASIATSERIKNLADILNMCRNDKILIVISALGKTTNALEKIVDAYWNKDANYQHLISQVKSDHLKLASDLLPKEHPVFTTINDLFVEIDWIVEDDIHDPYDYIYDQIVSMGELLSTSIVESYLRSLKFKTHLLDARDCIITNDTYREAKVDWTQTEKNIQDKVKPLFQEFNFLITQGFIASTAHNQNTTLGREGSDFTASIFSFVLEAESLSIWKDVPGILTADPNLFENVTKIDRLSYREAIEMTYYGAKVIHPKTIKPLQNKNIPLFVKSFINPEAAGTLIAEEIVLKLPPVVVVEHNQALLHISTKDFSFVAESHLSELFTLFNRYRIKVNMMRNTAISFSICTHDLPKRLDPLVEELKEDYKVILDRDLELITVRHFNEQTVNELIGNKIVLFEERLRDTIQMVIKNTPLVKRKAD